jgi:hypothetical protein
MPPAGDELLGLHEKLDLADASQIPAIAEPWFLAFNASIEIHPVMLPDDLAKAAPAIERAVNC